MRLEDLPQYVLCPDCGNKHFLSINRDAYGMWAIGYVEYVHGEVLQGLALNNCETVAEAAERMKYALIRFGKRHGGGHGTVSQR